MSQFVQDDHLDPQRVRDLIARWSTARFLREFRPGEVIKDERVPAVLATLRTPTFITIDEGFRNRKWRSRRYCILLFALRHDEQADIEPLLRRLLRPPEFRTRAARMGKVARVSREGVRWWQLGEPGERSLHRDGPSRRRAEQRVAELLIHGQPFCVTPANLISQRSVRRGVDRDAPTSLTRPRLRLSPADVTLTRRRE